MAKSFIALFAFFALVALAAGCGGGGNAVLTTKNIGGGGSNTNNNNLPVVIVQTAFPVSGVVSTTLLSGVTYPIDGAQVEMLRSGAVLATTTTTFDGSYSFANVSTGTVSLRVSETSGVSRHFIGVTTQSYGITATATIAIPVSAAYQLTASAVNANLNEEHFVGGNYQLVCPGKATIDQLALNGSTTFVDVPEAVGCTLTVTNPGMTTPKMATDVPATQTFDMTQDQSIVLQSIKPTCVIDADCPIPLGMTTPVCLDAGTSASSCAAF